MPLAEARLRRAIEWLVIVHGAIAFAIMIMASLRLAILWILSVLESPEPLRTILMLVGFLPLVVVATLRRKDLSHGEGTPRLKMLFVISAVLAQASAIVFFGELSHDVGGRMSSFPGFVTSSLFSDVLPWSLFTPLPICVVTLMFLNDREGR